ncbi:hypothetical protein BJY52DRAFT_1227901 [Lactarius psammicola]|nr:hypothetical protein BJY52DRAFT_1227901 [Lactarius psammicola]
MRRRWRKRQWEEWWRTHGAGDRRASDEGGGDGVTTRGKERRDREDKMELRAALPLQRMATLEDSVQELTESHKKLMGTQKQILSMMLAVCSHLGIKVTMPDDSTAFAVVHSTVSSIPSPLVDDISALSIGRAPASAAPSVASASSAHSSMRSGTSAFCAHPLSTVGGGSHHGSAAVSRASFRGHSQATYGISEQSPNGIVQITWDRSKPYVIRSEGISRGFVMVKHMSVRARQWSMAHPSHNMLDHPDIICANIMYSHINISQTTWSSSVDDIDGGDNQAEETSVYSFGSTLSLQSSNGVGRDGNTVHWRRHMTSDHPYTSFSDPVDVSSSDAESFDEDDMYGSDHNMREVVMESLDEEWVEGSQCSDDRVDHMDIEAINYCGSDDRIETTSGSSDDEQGADTSHSVEDMIKRRQHVTNGPGTLSSSGN